MNSRLDWFVLSDYYSNYVTNPPPGVMVCKFFLTDHHFYHRCWADSVCLTNACLSGRLKMYKLKNRRTACESKGFSDFLL